MRVLFISFEYPPKIIGGMGTYAEHLVRGLSDRGIDIYTITRGDNACHDEKTYRVLTPDKLYWRRFYFIREAMNLVYKLDRLYKFDLVHLNGTYPIIGRLKLPTMSTFHAIPNVKQFAMGLKSLRGHRSAKDITYLILKNPVGSLFDVLTAKASDKIICPSPILARDLVSYCFADEQKIHVVPNGVDLKRFDETRSYDSSFLDKYAIQRETFLLYMGRLSFIKGIQYLIEAFRIVQSQHPALKLVIAGSGNFELQLRKIARNIKGIVFVGYIDSIMIKKLLYGASLAVVLPSHLFEVFPMSILEGMAHGKPVLATNIGGNSFMIEHGENGFLSKPKDPENLAKYIDMLYEDQALRRKMGMLGRKLVEEKFTLDRMLSETLKVYDSLT